MEHPTNQELAAYFDGSLTGDVFTSVDDHIQVCDECQDRLADVQQLPPEETDTAKS